MVTCSKGNFSIHNKEVKHVFVEVNCARTREKQMASAFDIVADNLHAGHNVLVHCRGGRHRAPTVAAICISALTSMSLSESCRLIESKRPQVEMRKALDRPHKGEPPLRLWADHMVKVVSNNAAGRFMKWTQLLKLHRLTSDSTPLRTACGGVAPDDAPRGELVDELAGIARGGVPFCQRCWAGTPPLVQARFLRMAE